MDKHHRAQQCDHGVPQNQDKLLGCFRSRWSGRGGWFQIYRRLCSRRVRRTSKFGSGGRSCRAPDKGGRRHGRSTCFASGFGQLCRYFEQIPVWGKKSSVAEREVGRLHAVSAFHCTSGWNSVVLCLPVKLATEVNSKGRNSDPPPHTQTQTHTNRSLIDFCF